MFIAADPYARLYDVVDTGHCMRHVQVVAGVPHSSLLRRGERVRDAAEVPRGTVIGTFGPTGRYENKTDGSSHVAIFIERRAEGLLVVDQWVRKPVSERVIRYKAGAGPAVDDADRYFIVETEGSATV